MKVLFSTAYMPPIAYMATLMKHATNGDELFIEEQETFPKQTYRNRAVIMTANGAKPLSVPVVRRNHSRTEEVLIDYKERWNVIHLRTLEAAYSASPYYLYYKDALEAILMHHYERLVDLNGALLEWLLERLKIGCTITATTDFQVVITDADYRNTFSPKVPYPTGNMPPYYQVFADRIPFTANLSIIDLLMNLGPEARSYLEKTH
jgi:leucyl aminopeptidase (aminopeptidase T)